MTATGSPLFARHPAPARKMWHCVACQVGWSGGPNICWSCEKPGVSGFLTSNTGLQMR